MQFCFTLGKKVNSKTLSIEVHALTKKYGQDLLALNGLTFSVQKGDIFGFLDPKGPK